MRQPKTNRHPDRRYARAQKRWEPYELEYLGSKYGLITDRAICRHLQRSPAAIHIKAVRVLHLSRSMNFYTSKSVAVALGVKDAKKVIYWLRKGWIKGRHCFVGAGLSFRWMFREKHIVQFLRSHPWFFNPKTMPEHYFRSIVREEYDIDPWYTPSETAPMLGVSHSETVKDYIRNNWLKAVRFPQGGSEGKWLVRHSAIEDFLSNDPRPEHRFQIASLSRYKTNRKKGVPIRLSATWSVICPACGQTVVVRSAPWLKACQVQEYFIRLYNDGACNHGITCDLIFHKYQVKEILKKQD